MTNPEQRDRERIPHSPAWTEAGRLMALDQYGILDTPREAEFDDVVRLAADTFDAPIAVVNLIADGRQWFKAEVGIGADELPLDVSICVHAILQRGVFVVPDTTKDRRFDRNPLVTGEPGLRFYAGALLETPDGLPLGTVCVLDTKPRPEGISAHQKLTLEILARQVMTQLELRRALADREHRTKRLEEEIASRLASDRVRNETEERYRLAARATNDAVWDWDLTANSVLWNEALQDAYGHRLEDVAPTGDWWIAHIHPDDRQRIDDTIHTAIDGTTDGWSAEYRFLRADGTYADVLDRGHIIRATDGKATRMIGAMLDLTDRRRTEAALLDSEERLRLAVEHAEIGFWDVDIVNDKLIWPPRTKAMFGISPDVPVTMQDFYDGLHPADRERTVAAYTAAADPMQRLLYDIEYRTIGKEDGIVRWVAAKGRGVFDDRGRCLRVVGTAIDISERKRIRADLRASEARLRVFSAGLEQQIEDRAQERARLWQISPDLLSVVDLDSACFDRVNPAWTDALGWTPEEVDGQPYTRFVHPDDMDASSKAFEQVRAGTPVLRFENRYRAKDGGWRWLSWVAVPEGGKLYSTTRDVTEEKLRADALAAATAERDRAWRLSQVLLVTAETDGTLIAINQSWTMLLGWTEADLVGHSIIEFTHPDDHEATKAVFADVAEKPLSTPREFRFRSADGHYRWFAWTAAFEDGRVYASGRDVTAEREQAAELAAAEEALRQSQKMEAVGQLTGGIAHDFNNMLAVVIASLNLLERRVGIDDARAKQFIDAAIDGARRAASLTQRLLAFSRQQPLKPEAVNVNTLVSGMSDLLHHSVGGNVQLEAVLAAELWPISADPNQLENVILNLAINARDAMPNGGRVTIETHNADLHSRRDATHIGVPPGQYVLITVSDTGIGMPEEVMAKAFDPFFTTKGVGKGTGLGLSQVYGFIKQSDGHVKICSEPGEGTAIRIYLPRLVGETASQPESPVENDLPRREERQEVVLVVEDEPAVRQVSVDALREFGYRVLEADSAAAALRLLDANPDIALLFTDVVMPEVNGAKLAEEARRRRPKLPVLFTTGYARDAAIHGGKLESGVELIGKPFTIDELAAKVRAVLDASQTDDLPGKV